MINKNLKNCVFEEDNSEFENWEKELLENCNEIFQNDHQMIRSVFQHKSEKNFDKIFKRSKKIKKKIAQVLPLDVIFKNY